MAAEANRKISAASSSKRGHTGEANQNSSPRVPSGIRNRVLLVLFVVILAWAYQASQPPQPKICGTPDGPPVTASRIKLKDGRHLAYREHGVSKDVAKFKIIFIHAFDSSRYDVPELSQGTAEELGVYLLSFDRPGYGESDPHPKRTLKSLTSDIEELADQLELGLKFYVMGFSLGGEMVWTCLKYIPQRLAGAALLSPVINYWWPNFPANLSAEGYRKQLAPDQWGLRVVHYAPWLTYWWYTQKWFPSSTVIPNYPENYSPHDLEILSKFPITESNTRHARQQGEHESLYRDFLVGFGTWDFDPMDLENPFPNNEGSVYIWHGHEDGFVPVMLQRYIVQRLPWVRYRELPGMGHMFAFGEGMFDTIVKAMLKQDQ